jgi:ferredoxin
MVRQIIRIDEKLCNGCGLCVSACHEDAIKIVDKKAKLLRDDYCDGLGNCLPVCPTGAISFESREALEFNEEEVKKNMDKKQNDVTPSMLGQWPVQIQLVPHNAPYFSGADILIAADCTAFSYGDFHSFMKDKITLIGCPKLDDADYSEKITHILKSNKINSITVIRMEVPCCGGIVHAVKTAITNSGELIPWRVVTISTEGTIVG